MLFFTCFPSLIPPATCLFILAKTMSISHLSKLCMFPFYRFYFKDTIKSEETADCVTVSSLPTAAAVRKYDQDQNTDVLSGKTMRSNFVQRTSYTKSSNILF